MLTHSMDCKPVLSLLASVLRPVQRGRLCSFQLARCPPPAPSFPALPSFRHQQVLPPHLLPAAWLLAIGGGCRVCSCCQAHSGAEPGDMAAAQGHPHFSACPPPTCAVLHSAHANTWLQPAVGPLVSSCPWRPFFPALTPAGTCCLSALVHMEAHTAAGAHEKQTPASTVRVPPFCLSASKSRQNILFQNIVPTPWLWLC